MDCLVTGGAGFIGSNLVDALLARGDRVHMIDNLSTGKRANLQSALAHGATLHEIDMRDAPAVLELSRLRPPGGRVPHGRADRRALLGGAAGR